MLARAVERATVALQEQDVSEAITTAEAKKQQQSQFRMGCVRMLAFFVFLIVFTTSSLLAASDTAARMIQHIESLIDSKAPMPLSEVRTIDTMWHYLETSLVPVLYADDLLDPTNDPMEGRNSLRPLDYTNKVLGSVQVRQARVDANRGCATGSSFSSFTVQCYAGYQTGRTDSTTAFGVRDRFKFSEEVGRPFSGQLGSYAGGGFVVPMPYNRTQALATVVGLRRDGYVDPASRAIFFHFNVWNMNTHEYLVATLCFEISTTGLVVPSVRSLVLQQRDMILGGQGSMQELATVGLDLLVLVFTIFYLGEELLELYTSLAKYLGDGWNVMDLLNLGLLVAAFAYRARASSFLAGVTVGEAELSDPFAFTDLGAPAEFVQTARLLNALNALLIWAKIIKYTGYFPYVRVLVVTIEHAFVMFLPFLSMFAVIFMGFVLACTMGFGDRFWGLSDAWGTATFLARSFVGDANVLPLYGEQPFFAGCIWLLYILFAFCLLLNIFFAIMAQAFVEVQSGEVAIAEDTRVEMVTQTVDSLVQFLLNALDFKLILKKTLPGVYYYLFPPGKETKSVTLVEEFNSQPSKRRRRREGTSEVTSGSATMTNTKSSFNRSTMLITGKKGPTPADVARSLENMAGAMLGKLQTIGFEVTSEMRESRNVLQALDQAVMVLNMRLEKIQEEQEELLDS